jgi:rhodanese-related sulfurtransferase
MTIKKLIFQILVISFISILSGVLFNSLSANGIPLLYKSPDLESGSRLTSEQTYQLYRDGRALFIDTRYGEEYETGHIKNAVNLPVNSSRDEIMVFLKPLPKDRIIVTYCSSPSCNWSRRLAGFLSYRGYEKVYVFLAGFEEWEKKDYPIDRK